MSRLKPHRLPWLLAGASVLLLSLIVAFGPAHADWSDEERAERIGSGDPQRGAALAAMAGCPACHGDDAATLPNPPAPRLHGQLAAYTRSQLLRFASGQRAHPPLPFDASQLEAGTGDDLAAGFASQSPRLPTTTRRADADADSLRLFNAGDRRRDVIACRSCHGSDARGALSGSDANPALAGQSADYLRARLRVWRSGPQGGEPISVMHLIARTLADAEIDALAAFLSQQPPTP